MHIFLLILKICVDKNFLLWLLPDFFQKISNFPNFFWSSNNFSDFSSLSWPTGNPALVGGNSKGQKPIPVDIPHVSYMDNPWNSTSFFNWTLEFPCVLCLISLKNLCPEPFLSPVWIFSRISPIVHQLEQATSPELSHLGNKGFD